jgi:hypothetical protein
MLINLHKKPLTIQWIATLAIIGNLMLWPACIKPYNANIHNASTGYLVVSGNLNSAPAGTIINLSRTVPISDTATTVYENGATVAVECSDGTSFPATFMSLGNYNLGVLPLDSTKQYRLDIHDQAGNQYLSEYVAVIPCPPIDSISVTYDGSGAHILANTHNPQGNSRNYIWSYEETWEYHSAEYSYIYYEPTPPYFFSRNPDQQIYTCWDSAASTSLLIYSTSKLSSDIVDGYQINEIPLGDWRLSVEYSILVSQNTLSDSAFYYLQIMQSNTENLGSIFDPLPSNPKGNITCVNDPSQPVVGYVNASGFSQTRIFVASPAGWPFNFQCTDKDTTFGFDVSKYEIWFGEGGDGNGGYEPLELGPLGDPGIISNLTTCVDCKVRGGFTTKPSYMP